MIIGGKIPRSGVRLSSLRGVSRLGETRSDGMWGCNSKPGIVMTYAEAMAEKYKNPRPGFPGATCYPLDPPAPSAPASSGGGGYSGNITLTQIQSPVQNQASEQAVGIGNKDGFTTGGVGQAANDASLLATLAELLAAQKDSAPSSPVATPSTSSTSVMVGGGSDSSGETFAGFLENNKWLLIGSSVALAAFIWYMNRKKKK